MEQEKQLRQRMFEYLRGMYQGVLPPNLSIQELLDTGYGFEQAAGQFNKMSKYVSSQVEDEVLDAGSGFGYFVSYCLNKGINCYGYEVDEGLVNISKDLLIWQGQDADRIKKSFNDRIPFPDSFFDVVSVHYVADYVQNIPFFLQELRRVLKDDGQIYLINLNYMNLYCNIYYLFFIPWLPRIINKFYLKLRGRTTKFFDMLTFITPRSLEKEAKRQALICFNKSLDEWLDFIEHPDFSNRSAALIKIVKFLDFFHFRGLLKLMGRFGFYSPMIFIMQKNL